MSSSASINSAPNQIITINSVIAINEKLTASTFPQWRAQFEALLIGYDLMNFVTGDLQCPAIDTENLLCVVPHHVMVGPPH